MRYFTGIFFFVVMIAACSTPEMLSEEPVEVEPEASMPEWYDSNRVSFTDSTDFYGYSMATAVDSVEAINLGNESAITNLRFEIDKFTEEVREQLAANHSGDQHRSPQFIIKLRNSVQELLLTDALIEREFEMRDDDVKQVYTRATQNRSEIIDRLSELLTDDAYIRALHADREEF